MNLDSLHPDVRKTIQKLPRLPFAHRRLLPLAKLLYNVAAAGPKPGPDTAVESVSVSNREHRITFKPSKQLSPAILWFHGGGHLAGKPSHVDGLASVMASALSAKVVAPAYGLAPADPFPTGLEHAYESWVWLNDNASELGIDPSKLAIGGNSAGAGMAASLAQKILDLGGPQAKAQVLFYPMLDDRVAADRSLDVQDHFVWSNRANFVAWSEYLRPFAPGEESLPKYASPARTTDLEGLPPAWIGHCGLDLFSTENEKYASRLEEAGVECDLYTVDGVPHAFEVMCPEVSISKEFIESAVSFLDRKLNGERTDSKQTLKAL